MTSAQPGFFFTILSFVLVIGPLIFVHELGHYLVGRACGVKAEVFSIGFGRELFGWTDGKGTRWKVCLLPLGGYVKFAGDMNAAGQPSREWLMLPAEERARTFQAKPVWQRFLIVAAGPFTNFLIAILIIAGFVMAIGKPVTPPVIAKIQAGSAAAKAGLRPLDRITAIDGHPIADFEDLQTDLMLKRPVPIHVDFVRGGRTMSVVAHLTTEVERDQFRNETTRSVLGVWPVKTRIVTVSPFAAIGTGFQQTWRIVSVSAQGMKQIVVGERSIKDLSGPLKTARFSGEQTSLGPLSYLWFLVVVSINLGFINLLPIPMLDGGHLLFYVIEAVRRRPLQPQAQEWAFRTGLAALLALMIFVTLNDLASFGLWSKLGGLIGGIG
ncbi:MAG TPA: M50 family metallopeptidase [Allosphingosinicella sp.]|nr:M50 family metallopeptidase [Allosphingosinicella sp.]